MRSDNFCFGYFCRAHSCFIADLIAKNIPWKYGGLTADRWLKQDKERYLYPITNILMQLLGSVNFSYKPQQIAEDLAKKIGPLAYGAKTLTDARGQKINLFLPADVFDPDDPWSIHFRQVLAQRNFYRQSICELGPGSGITAIEILRSPYPPQSLTLVEIDEHVLKVAELNLRLNCGDLIEKLGIQVEFIPGDAVTVLAKLAQTGKKFNTICGCLPQVPLPSKELLRGQNIAHGYSATVYQGFERWGLGLLEAVQQQAKQTLVEQGSFITAYSGRVPQKIFDQFHNQLQAKATTLKNVMVKHCSTTPLNYLFGAEGNVGLLFKDELGKIPITPEVAEHIRLQADNNKCSVFHYLIVSENTYS